MKRIIISASIIVTILLSQIVNEELMEIQVPFWGPSSLKYRDGYTFEEKVDLMKSGKWIFGYEIIYLPFKVSQEEPIDAVYKVLFNGRGQIVHERKRLHNPLSRASSYYYADYTREEEYYEKLKKEFIDAEIKNDTAYVYLSGNIWEQHLGLSYLKYGLKFPAAQFVNNDIDRVKIYFDSCTVDWGYGVINKENCIEND